MRTFPLPQNILPAVLFATAVITSAVACSSSFSPKSCSTDADCGDGLVCALETQPAVCRAASDSPLRIGMSAPATGPSQDLGVEMKKGVTLAFDAQNASGGIRGRKLELVFRDDQYIPDNAEAAVRDLLEVEPTQLPARCPTSTNPPVAGQTAIGPNAIDRGPDGVIALLGNVGTPTMVRTAPIAVETQTLFFGAFTGSAKVLRDGSAGPACSRYIFNVRASYGQEARATLEYFFKQGVPDGKHIISFDQNDTFGQAGYDGIINAYTALKGSVDSTPPADEIKRFRYVRDDVTSVPAQVQATTQYLSSVLAADSANHTVGIMATGTYGPVANYIQAIRQWQYANDADQTTSNRASRLNVVFSAVSFVGPNTLAARLRSAGTVNTPKGALPYTDGVVVSQVVPNYDSDNSDVVKQYRDALNSTHQTASFTSLEGYVAARVFIAGMLAHKGPFVPTALLDTFEQLPSQDLGLGASSFSAQSHQYLKSVWGTAISADGTFSNRYFWTDGTAIQLFE